MRAIVALIMVMLTAGCSSLSTAPVFEELQPVHSPDAAVVTVFRTAESPLYMLRSAPVHVAGAESVSLPRGSFHPYVLDPGQYRFLSKTFDAASECVLHVDLRAGRQYFLEVVPNNEAVGKLLTDSFIWMARVAATEQITTLSVGEYNQLCQGMFAFVPIPHDIAMGKLPGLKLVE